MTPEELDVAIELLLEERPNEEKPKRRRRNKFKDMKKQARRGEFKIPDSILEELVGDSNKKEIEYVYVYFTEREDVIGTVNGWYDAIKQISKETGVPTQYLRLEKVTDYDWENDRVVWDGDALVYEKSVYASSQYYDKDMNYITSRGVYRPYNVGNKPPIEEGVYVYDQSMQETIREIFGSSPEVEYEATYYTSLFRRITETPFDSDTTGKYEKYRLAYLEQEHSNYLGKSEPIHKGDIVGTSRNLIHAMNANSRKGLKLVEGVDKELMEYEDAIHDVYYEYWW